MSQRATYKQLTQAQQALVDELVSIREPNSRLGRRTRDELAELLFSGVPDKRSLWVAVTVFLLAASAVLAWIYWKLLGYAFDDADARAQFGDSFGAAGALVSALAFCGLIASIQLQLREVRLQREELSEQREEIRRGNDALDKSTEIAGFSSFLDFHRNVIARHLSTDHTLMRKQARQALLQWSNGSGQYPLPAAQEDHIRTIGNYYNELGLLVRNWPADLRPDLRIDVLEMVRTSATELYPLARAWGDQFDSTGFEWGHHWAYLLTQIDDHPSTQLPHGGPK